jgi:hypothetical protein
MLLPAFGEHYGFINRAFRVRLKPYTRIYNYFHQSWFTFLEFFFGTKVKDEINFLC